MESDVEKKIEWKPIGVGPATYNLRINRAIEGLSDSSTSEDRKFVENLPNLAVECMKCGKIHRFADYLKGCPNCSSTSIGLGGSPSRVSVECGRCDQTILESITCECGCVNPLNSTTLREPKTSSGVCFIATATYGSPLAPEVVLFRRFRDDVLLNSRRGRIFVTTYYKVSPPFAFLLSKSRLLRKITRDVLLQPLLRRIKK
ncbi:MAG: CFI-box-CTERM domain-containing protein [Acidobacteriota bacterium]